MKLYNKLGWAVLPFALLAVSCQNDDFMEASNEAAEGVMTLHATMAPQTRAQIALGTEDESREIFMWNEEDSFTLYDKTNPTTTSAAFTISGYSEEAPATEATFVGEGNFADGSSVVAIYPAQEGNITESAATLTLPTATITTGSAEEWKEYMRQSMYMYADATMDGNNTQLAFKHLCVLIRVSYTNATPEDKTITNVTVTGEGNYFGSIAKFEFANNALTSTQTSSTCEFDFSGLTVASGRTTDFYFFFFPGDDASNGTLTVSINDKDLEMSLSELTSFSGFEAGKRYWFNTIETPDEGIIWKKDVPEVLITNLPLIELAETMNRVQFEKDENGYVNVTLNQEKINQVKVLNLDEAAEEIVNLDGLEYFTDLVALVAMNKNLTTLDVSKLPNLNALDCSENPELKELDVSANTKLQALVCQDTGISELNLSNNLDLMVLTCARTNITILDLSKNTKLTDLECSDTKLSELNISNNVELVHLMCQNTDITDLDLSKNTKLENADLNGCTLLSSIDVSHNLELWYLWMVNCSSITQLDVSKNTKLKELNCRGTGISSIDVRNNTALNTLYCHETSITELDLSKNTELTDLSCSSTKITELDLTNNTKLTSLDCSFLDITELDVSLFPLLNDLSCTSIPISKLDLSNNPDLESLECSRCRLIELDITGNPKLTYLSCGKQYGTSEENPMTLYLTANQKQNLWDGNMEWETTNEGVNPVVK